MLICSDDYPKVLFIQQSPLEALLESKKREAALVLVNKEQEAEIHDLKSLFKEGMTPTQFCKMLNGIIANRLKNDYSQCPDMWQKIQLIVIKIMSLGYNGLSWKTMSHAKYDTQIAI
ncbi:hypothetical protein [Symbiopectobacterium sp. RP]|uniref:hypothetical protein n=1 Tax=Symbiopectobacterium sp. RP TaxID=3248553 RepID=UPI003D2A6EAA